MRHFFVSQILAAALKSTEVVLMSLVKTSIGKSNRIANDKGRLSKEEAEGMLPEADSQA